MKLKQFFAGKFRRLVLLAFDCFLFGVSACAYYVALSLAGKNNADRGIIFANAAIILGAVLIARLAFGVYNSVWRYTRTLSYLKLILADVTGTIAAVAVIYIAKLDVGFEIFLILVPINCIVTLTSRYCYRLYYKQMNKVPVAENKMLNVAIIGAGQLGAFLANELLCNHQSTYKPMFFVDKDPQKIGNNVVGLKVYPEDEQTLKFIKEQKITELFVAVANLDNEEATRLFEFYSKTKCKLKIYDIPVKDFNRDDECGEKGKVIRDFQIEDLLFRKPMKINNSATRAY